MVVAFRYGHRSLSLLADGEAFRRRTGMGHGAGDCVLSGAPATGAQNQAARTQRVAFVRSGNPHDPGAGSVGDNCGAQGIFRSSAKLAGKPRRLPGSQFASNWTPAAVA